MIKATFKKRADFLTSFYVDGHANYSSYGKDIVCAGVSSLVISVSNYLLSHNYGFNDQHDGITFSKLEEAQVPAEILLNGLESIAVQYPEHVVVEIQRS